MLSRILERRDASPAAIRAAAFLYGVNQGASVRLTVEKFAAEAGTDKRCLLGYSRRDRKTGSPIVTQGAVDQLKGIGVPVEIDGGDIVFHGRNRNNVEPFQPSAVFVENGDYIQCAEATVAEPTTEEERARKEQRKAGIFADCVQLSFDALDAQAPSASSRRTEIPERYPTMQAAALRVSAPPALGAHSVSAERAQCERSVSAERFENAKAALSEVQKSLFDKIKERLAGKMPEPAPESQKKQSERPIPINNINNPIIPISIPNPTPKTTLDSEVQEKPISQSFSAARYVEYLDATKERFPGWNRPIKNPNTGYTSNCGWAVERLARIMGWGAPQDVFEQVIEFVASSNPNVRARNPSAAFLYKIKQLSNKWRYE